MPSNDKVVLHHVATSERDIVLSTPAAGAPYGSLPRAALQTPVNAEASYHTKSVQYLRFRYGSFFEEIVEEQITLNGFVKRSGTLEDTHKDAIDAALGRANEFLQTSRPLTRVSYDSPYLVGSKSLIKFPGYSIVKSKGGNWSTMGLVDPTSRHRGFNAEYGGDAFLIHSAIVMDSNDERGFYDPEAWIESVDGHASQTGPAAGNLAYSRERAESVASYVSQLLGNRSTKDAVQFKGAVDARGSSQPEINHKGFELAENRRATFKLFMRRNIAHIPTATEFEMEYRQSIQQTAELPAETIQQLAAECRNEPHRQHADVSENRSRVRVCLRRELLLAYNAEALVKSSKSILPLEEFIPYEKFANDFIPGSAASLNSRHDQHRLENRNPLYIYIDANGASGLPRSPTKRAGSARDALVRWSKVVYSDFGVEFSAAGSAYIVPWLVEQSAAGSSVVLQYSMNLREVPNDRYIKFLKQHRPGNVALRIMLDVVDIVRFKFGSSDILNHPDTVSTTKRRFLDDEKLYERAYNFVEEHFRHQE